MMLEKRVMQLPLLSATYSKSHNSGKDNDYQHFIQTNKYSGHNDFSPVLPKVIRTIHFSQAGRNRAGYSDMPLFLFQDFFYLG